MTRQAFENAIVVVMAVGGSTNAILHLLAMAHAAEVPLSIDDFEMIRQRVPVLCDLKPSGRYVATDLHRAGGIPQVMKMLLNHGLLHGGAITITGKTVAENLAEVPDAPPANQDVIHQWEQPVYPQGHLAILKGNLRGRLRCQNYRHRAPSNHWPGSGISSVRKTAWWQSWPGKSARATYS